MKEQISDELFSYCLDLEKQWQNSLPRLTDKDLLDIFPEAKNIIPTKISEWQLRRKQVIELLRQKLTNIKYKVEKEDQWFWEELVKVLDGEELEIIDRHISRLKRLNIFTNSKIIKGKIGQKEIEMALAIPIQDLIQQPVRQNSGKLLTFT